MNIIELTVLLTLCGQPVGIENIYPSQKEGIPVELMKFNNKTIEHTVKRMDKSTSQVQFDLAPILGFNCVKV